MLRSRVCMAPTDGAGQLWAGARCQQILVQGMPSFNTQSNPRQSLMWGEEDLSCRIPGVTGHPLRPTLFGGMLQGVCAPGAVGHRGCPCGNGREEAPAAAGASSIILLLGCSRRGLIIVVYSGLLLRVAFVAVDVMPLPSSLASAWQPFAGVIARRPPQLTRVCMSCNPSAAATIGMLF